MVTAASVPPWSAGTGTTGVAVIGSRTAAAFRVVEGHDQLERIPIPGQRDGLVEVSQDPDQSRGPVRAVLGALKSASVHYPMLVAPYGAMLEVVQKCIADPVLLRYLFVPSPVSAWLGSLSSIEAGSAMTFACGGYRIRARLDDWGGLFRVGAWEPLTAAPAEDGAHLELWAQGGLKWGRRIVCWRSFSFMVWQAAEVARWQLEARVREEGLEAVEARRDLAIESAFVARLLNPTTLGTGH